VWQQDLGRSPRTVDAYARSLVDYLRFCDRHKIGVTAAGRAEIAGYVRDLRERPGRHGPGVVALNSGVGLANATLQLRITVLRLFYDFLDEEAVRDRNPVGRGSRTADGRGGRRGLVPRFARLPWIPTDAQCRPGGSSRPSRSARPAGRRGEVVEPLDLLGSLTATVDPAESPRTADLS
jgi:hypothetical protein